MTIVFNHGYPPKAGILRVRGIAGAYVADKFGQLYLNDDIEAVKFAEKHHLRYWVYGELTPEEQKTGIYRINHFVRYQLYNEIEKMTDRDSY
ncbi:MAG: hypothetical protein PHF63_02145 [Herbinix sp.]|nr:hypothetical protein [Herbinix sp.]